MPPAGAVEAGDSEVLASLDGDPLVADAAVDWGWLAEGLGCSTTIYPLVERAGMAEVGNVRVSVMVP